MRRTLQVSQGIRYVSIGLVVALGGTSGMASGATASRVPQAQKISAQLDGDCADKVMDEAEGDESCNFVVAVTPKSPARTFTFQRAEPGAKKWSTVKSQKVSTGKAIFAINELDDDGVYLDGKYSYRVTAPAIKGKEKAFVSPTLKVDFVPGEAADEASDDFTDDEATTATTAKTTQTTSKPSTATTPTTPSHSTGTTVATTTTVAAGTNGGTPTMTTTTVTADTFYTPVRSSSEITNSNLCANNGGPVATSVCDSVKTSKSKAELTTVLAGISSIYVRDNFCRWMFGFADKGVTFDNAGAQCAQVNAKS